MTGLDLLHPGVRHYLINTLRWDGLRSTQDETVAPLMRDDDALVTAPTAGGKTEVAKVPVLSGIVEPDWRGLSMLYLGTAAPIGDI